MTQSTFCFEEETQAKSQCNGKIILHLCADIGSDSKPYRDAGYDVRLIGKEIGVENYYPPQGGGIRNFGQPSLHRVQRC